MYMVVELGVFASFEIILQSKTVPTISHGFNNKDNTFISM